MILSDGVDGGWRMLLDDILRLVRDSGLRGENKDF